MNHKTLLLNQGYQPLKAINCKRAICMSFLEKVDILETYDCFIASATMKIPVPAVVRLKKLIDIGPTRIRFSRTNIFLRDEYVCQYCNRIFHTKNLTLDHVVPRSFGGRTSWSNIVTCCKKCNNKKADRTPKDANMRLLKRPCYPNIKSYYTAYVHGQLPEEWSKWLF